jgi:hypothetical protein
VWAWRQSSRHGSNSAQVIGCSAVLHICPPDAPERERIAKSLIRAMTETGVERLYSVMHPVRRAVRHHAYKLMAKKPS